MVAAMAPAMNKRTTTTAAATPPPVLPLLLPCPAELVVEGVGDVVTEVGITSVIIAEVR